MWPADYVSLFIFAQWRYQHIPHEVFQKKNEIIHGRKDSILITYFYFIFSWEI